MNPMNPMQLDAVLAAADLADRAGAKGFDIGYTEDNPPTWHATAFYVGKRLFVDGYPNPEDAATGLSERLLTGAACKCGRKVTLRADTPGCLWRLDGRRWSPGCDVPPIETARGSRGDTAALQKAMRERVAERKRRAS